MTVVVPMTTSTTMAVAAVAMAGATQMSGRGSVSK